MDDSGFRAHDAHVHITPAMVDPAADQLAYVHTRDTHGIGIAALVTPSTMGWDNETSFAVAASDPARFRVIARADLRADDAAQHVAGLLARGASGVRLTLLGADDTAWLEDGSCDDAFAVLNDAGAAVEMHAAPADLVRIAEFADRWPGARIVIDHLGRPDPARGPESPGFRAFLALAAHRNVIAKTPNSTFFSVAGAPFADLVPFYERALDAFGPTRLMWASDWPLCVRDHPFESAWEPLTTVLGGRSNRDADFIWRSTFTRTFTGMVTHD